MPQFSRLLCLSLVVTFLCVTRGWAQESKEDDVRRDDGFTVNTVSVSGTYFSQSVPADVSVFEDVFLGAGESVSGAANIRWRRTRQRSLVVFDSISAYGSRVQQTKRSNWSSDASNSWNELASLLATRGVGHWRFSVSGDGAVMNFDEAMFSTSASSQIIGAASDFRAVAGTLLNPATPTAAGLQTDATTVRFLFGRRVASVGGSAEIAYARSPRLLMGLNVGASQIKHLNDGSNVIGLDYLQANNAASGGYVTYSPSKTTTIGVEAKGLYSESTFATTTGTSGSVSFQKMARKYWFASGSVGAGWTKGPSDYRSVIYTAGGGFTSRAHTFFGYYNRDISELYVPALGPDSAFFSTMSGSWFWSRPRARWWSHISYSHYRDQPPAGVPAPTSWRLLETVGWQTGRHFFVTAEYSIGKTGARRYIRDGKRFQLEENAARLSLSWSPRALVRRR